MRTARFSQFLATTAFTFLLSSACAHADALRVNGVCEFGNCASVSPTPTNTSTSTPFNFTYQFANTDLYRVQGVAFAYQISDSTRYEDGLGPSDFMVTYLGNSTNTPSASDVLSSEFLGRYPAAGAGTGTYFASLQGIFGPGLGLASAAAATFTIDGHVISTIGPILASPGSFYQSDSGTYRVAAGPQSLDYDYVLTFGAGTTPGSSIELYPSTPLSPTPEPSSLVLLGTGFAALGTVIRRQLVVKSSTRLD